MIIYFLEANKIYTFKLPLEVSGNYILSDYDVNGNKRSLVSVEANNGKWVIKDNDEVKIYYNNMYNREATLELYHFYQLVVYGTETVLMYIAPAYDNSFICTRVQDNTTIHIGSDACDINFPIIGKKQLEISYKKGSFSFKNLNPNVPIYVNNSKKELGSLNNFDVIFIMGLRILILGGNIYVNNPNNQVILVSNKFSKPQLNLLYEDYKANAEFYKDFYDEKDYFYKTPVFQNALEKKEVTIAPPPMKTINKTNPLIMQLVPSALMSITSIYSGMKAFTNMSTGQGTKEENMLSIVTCVVMLIVSFVWPFIERLYEKLSDKILEKRRQSIYKKYLKEKESIFENIESKQKAALVERYLSLQECQQAIINKSSNLFSRGYDNENFLSVRLGIGNVDLNAEVSFSRAEYDEVKDNLLDKAEDLLKKYKTIKDAPYSLSLYDKKITAFIGSDFLKKNYLNSMILQLIAYHSYADLRLVILSDNAAPSSFKYLRESNYCFSDDKSFRFYSETFEDGQIISEFLEKIFVVRQGYETNSDGERNRTNFPFYLILSDNISIYKNLKIINDILESKNNLGFGLLMFDERVDNIPEGCKNFVNYNEKEGYYFTSEMDVDSIRKFKPEFIGADYIDVNIDQCISRVSNIPIKVEVNDSGSLPESLGFLEMFGVGKLDQLNILNRWENSNVVNSLATPIGVDSNGNLLYLDLHEKKHGPHGLVAGMTGSGKSETIVTYLLSLAVNYSPNEVQFVLIDYKGGGLAGAFENRKTGVKLPHLVGTITNLDQAEMKRTLVSIKSELQRRQRVFNQAKEQLNTGTIDIYKYQRLVRDGQLKDYMSHLFIVCDEFAELKAQQPEFMDELVSAARIGRSLGIHLILATQKPTGVVDDQIWSNSKFKICCKVQTAEDSNEMIRKPDAAYIKESGRFYLQVGYDEYFIKGQSAYTGTNYVPSDKIRSKFSTAIEFINDQADVIKTVSKDTKEEKTEVSLGEELNNILKYIVELANQIGFKYQQLWLDNVPKELYLDSVRKKYNVETKPFEINPLIGEYDDPKNQRQDCVTLNLTRKGNTFITGIAGSGKTTLLSTLIYSTITTHAAEEVNFYIIDLVAETLNKFALAPQVGEVLTINDPRKIEKLFYYLQKMIEKRKKYYSINGGSFENDVNKGRSIFPTIIVIINGYDVFKEQFDELVDEVFGPFTRECNRYGIILVLASTETNLSYSISNNFNSTIALRLSDPTEYSMIFDTKEVMPSDNPGRGVIELDGSLFEFQTSIAFDFDSYDNNLNLVINKLNSIVKTKATKLPELPNTVTIASFKNESIQLSAVPVGIEVRSGCTAVYNFDRLINIILFGKEQSIAAFFPALTNIMSQLNDAKIIALSAYDFIEVKNDNIKFYKENFKAVLQALYKNIEKTIKDPASNNNKYVILIVGYTKLAKHFKKMKNNEPDGDIKDLDDLIILAKNSNKFRFVIFDYANVMLSVDDYRWYNLVQLNNGMVLSEVSDNQELFTLRGYYRDEEAGRDDAFIIDNGNKIDIKYVQHIKE